MACALLLCKKQRFERLSKSGAQGEQQREAASISDALLMLGQVVAFDQSTTTVLKQHFCACRQ